MFYLQHEKNKKKMKENERKWDIYWTERERSNGLKDPLERFLFVVYGTILR